MENFSIRRVGKELENFKLKNVGKMNKISIFFRSLTFEIFTENNKYYLMVYDNHLDIFTQLEITQRYPFKPYNVIYFNSKHKLPYLNNLNALTELFKNRDKLPYIFFFRCLFLIKPLFLSLKKDECYCCKSLMCTNEWCPSFTISNVLLEQTEIKFIECYSSSIGYRYIKNIYDNLFIKLPNDTILHIVDHL